MPRSLVILTTMVVPVVLTGLGGRPLRADRRPDPASSSRGSAKSKAETRERAEAHYARAMAALQAGRYDEALAAYRESYALLPRTQTLYGMAVVAHLTGANADAANYIASYLEKPDRDPALAKKLAGLLVELDRELGSARIEAPGPGPIRVDGEVAGEGPGPLMLRLAPGPHTMSHGELTVSVDIEVGREKDVALRPVPLEDVPAVAAESSGGAPTSLRPWYLATGGVAIASLATATYFGLEARAGNRELDRINAMPEDYQFGEAVEVRDRARRDALIANITGGIGIASAVATVALVLWPRSKGSSDRRAVTLIPQARGAAVEVRW
jgi:tetratricopeptide (TPR) repeat protein